MRDWTISIEFLLVVDCRLSSIFENWDDLNNAAKVLIYQTKGWEKNHLLIRIILIRSLLSFCFSLHFTVFVFIIIIIILQLQQKEMKKNSAKWKASLERRKNYRHTKNIPRDALKADFLAFCADAHNMNNIFLSPFYSFISHSATT